MAMADNHLHLVNDDLRSKRRTQVGLFLTGCLAACPFVYLPPRRPSLYIPTSSNSQLPCLLNRFSHVPRCTRPSCISTTKFIIRLLSFTLGLCTFVFPPLRLPEGTPI
ncbi:hypothetical protein B0T13DRAFT_223404 [Neurospora crassa]|nr:hypothetical protein B0T13DRAFT_223404 [Neurospora crassa]